jgi:hypothetical protein
MDYLKLRAESFSKSLVSTLARHSASRRKVSVQFHHSSNDLQNSEARCQKKDLPRYHLTAHQTPPDDPPLISQTGRPLAP